MTYCIERAANMVGEGEVLYGKGSEVGEGDVLYRKGSE